MKRFQYILKAIYENMDSADHFLLNENILLERKMEKFERLFKRIVYLGVVPLTALIVTHKLIGQPNIKNEKIIQVAQQVDELSQEEKIERKEEIKDELENMQKEKNDELRDQLIRHEGMRLKSYDDTTGNRTIGVGFNLERKDAKEVIESMGLNYYNVYNGSQKITEKQTMKLLDITIEEAKNDVKRLYGRRFFNLPKKVQNILINLMFNMGYNTFRQFKNFKNEILEGDWEGAAEQLMYSVSKEDGRYSRWWKQVTGGHTDLDKIKRVNPQNRGYEIITTLLNMN